MAEITEGVDRLPEMETFTRGNVHPLPQGAPVRPALPVGLIGREDRTGVEAYRTTPRRPRRAPATPLLPKAEVPPQVAARFRARREAAAAAARAANTPVPAPSFSLQALPLTVEDNQVLVHLPFAVDTRQLTAWLVQEGHFVAHPQEDRARAGSRFPDSQGWGEEYDPGSYYPWWVFPDPEHRGRSVFAFSPRPEDTVQAQRDGDTVAWADLGHASQQMLRRWLPVLAGFPRPPSR